MKHVMFAGLGLSWRYEYAQSFYKYLQEIGYVGKILPLGEHYIIAYSHKNFSPSEIQSNLSKLLNAKKEGEINEYLDKKDEEGGM